MSRVAEVLSVSRSQLHSRAAGTSNPRGPYCKAEDAELLPVLRRLVDARPTYGYWRIAACLEQGAQGGRAGVNQPQAPSSHPESERADAGALQRPPGRSPS